MNDVDSFKKAVTSDLNGYYAIDTPLIYGQFVKTLYAKYFELPGNNYQNYLSKNNSKFGNMVKLQDKLKHTITNNG